MAKDHIGNALTEHTYHIQIKGSLTEFNTQKHRY